MLNEIRGSTWLVVAVVSFINVPFYVAYFLAMYETKFIVLLER